MIKKLIFPLVLISSLFSFSAAANTTADPGVRIEGVVRAVAQACGGSTLLQRVTESSAHFNAIPSDMPTPNAEAGIRNVQFELSTELVGTGMKAFCASVTPDLNALIRTRSALSKLRDTMRSAQPVKAVETQNRLLKELAVHEGTTAAILGAMLKYLESPERASCKPRVVRCDYQFLDGRTDWTYPDAQGRCSLDNRAESVIAVKGMPGDLAEVNARCK